MRIRFRDLSLDETGPCVHRGPELLSPTPEALSVLTLLLRRAPRAVRWEELLEAIPARNGEPRDECDLTRTMEEIRAILGAPPGSPGPLEFVPGEGHLLAGEAHVVPGEEPGSGHVLVWGKRDLPLLAGPNVLGRDHDATVWVMHPSVSRRHALVTVGAARVLVEDLGSRNGTFLRGQPLVEPSPLEVGDELRLGCVVLRLEAVL